MYFRVIYFEMTDCALRLSHSTHLDDLSEYMIYRSAVLQEWIITEEIFSAHWCQRNNNNNNMSSYEVLYITAWLDRFSGNTQTKCTDWIWTEPWI